MSFGGLWFRSTVFRRTARASAYIFHSHGSRLTPYGVCLIRRPSRSLAGASLLRFMQPSPAPPPLGALLLGSDSREACRVKEEAFAGLETVGTWPSIGDGGMTRESSIIQG